MSAEVASLYKNPTIWLDWLSADFDGAGVDGLVPVKGYDRTAMRPEEVAIMEKAAHYGAQFVFFEARRNNRAAAAQAFVYVSDGPAEDLEFAKLHKRLWSWGGVPLLFRKSPGKVDLFRCASKPDFDQKTEAPKYEAYDTLALVAGISAELEMAKPWWDVTRLRNGTLWDDPKICKSLLSDTASAHRHLVDNIFGLYKSIKEKGLLSEDLQRRLLILSLLVQYLDERKALEPEYFARFKAGASSFRDVLGDGPALVSLLGGLEDRFNGHVFKLDDAQRAELSQSQQLSAYAELVNGKQDSRGQGSFWRLYSFSDLPVELISSIYQLFVTDKSSSIYTPPALVRLMLEEALSWDRIDRLIENDEVILDPACGSGVYLVEAYKRLILHWRIQNNWKEAGKADIPHLQQLLRRVQGVDLEEGAVKLAAFSLCLALCESLTPERIRTSKKLFPILEGETLHGKCFFLAKEEGLISSRVGVVVGNPPFKSKLSTDGAIRAAAAYKAANNELLPDTQLAYLFLVNAMDLLVKGGVLSMIQPAGFLYNIKAEKLRRRFLKAHDVREILDFVSVRGLFSRAGSTSDREKSGTADPKVVVVVALARKPDPSKKMLHAVFRRGGKAEAKQGFEIDYYDMCWLPSSVDWGDRRVWRAGLLGGGRVLSLVKRLSEFPKLRDYAESRGWQMGQGFIYGRRTNPKSAEHIYDRKLVNPEMLKDGGTIVTDCQYVARGTPIADVRTDEFFSGPFFLMRKQHELGHAILDEKKAVFADKIVGISGQGCSTAELASVDGFVTANLTTLKAYVAACSACLYHQKATSAGTDDLFGLPMPVDGDLDMSDSEQIVATDLVDFYRDLVRFADESDALNMVGLPALPAFNKTFLAPINAIYTDKPLIAHAAQTWPGIICQPYSFGPAQIDWSDTERLRGRLDKVLKERKSESLSVTRIARIYDGNTLYLLKPDRLRFWLRSIALRDADEVLADLRAQGF